MAKDKKSFIAYCEWQEIFEELSDEDAGKLIKHLLAYVNDQNPNTEEPLVKMAFISIKQTLKRDLKKYEDYIEKQRLNGSKGGRPKAKKPKPYLGKPKKPKKADNDNDNDSVSVSDNVILKEKEINTLKKKYGDKAYEWMINKLENYKLSSGKKYKSDYGAINSWVVDEWKKQVKTPELKLPTL